MNRKLNRDVNDRPEERCDCILLIAGGLGGNTSEVKLGYYSKDRDQFYSEFSNVTPYVKQWVDIKEIFKEEVTLNTWLEPPAGLKSRKNNA